MKVLLAGEGSDELGSLAQEPPYREPYEQGVLECLARRYASEIQVEDGVTWKRVRKYRAGNHLRAETRTVLGLALYADERKCTLVFSRDRDGYEAREDEIEQGITEAQSLFPNLLIVGGTANEELESWILSLLGDAKAESYSDPKAKLAERGILPRAQKVDVARASDLLNLPHGANSLRRWLERATKAFAKS